MKIGSTEILDSYAEAFGARYTRLIVTAADEYWLEAALGALTGYGTSVIGCDAEVGVERHLPPAESPDGRSAAAVLLFAFTAEAVKLAAQHRVAQCILTAPSTACFNGLPDAAESFSLGKYLRYFGDGFESRESRVDGREPELGNEIQAEAPGAGTPGLAAGPQPSTRDPRPLWYIPMMDGEFCVEAKVGVAKGIAGGNIIIQATNQASGLAAGRRAAAAMAPLRGVITPFPGGVCRSGSKVGANKYKTLHASTAEAYCPTLRDQVKSELVAGTTCAYEIVIDGVDEPAITAAMRAATEAAAGDGVLAISASNYGGKLGKYSFHMHDLFT